VEPNIALIHERILPGVTGGVEPVPNPIPVPNPEPTPPPPPPPPPAPVGLDVDGMWGNATTRRAQAVLGTPVDGEIWYQYLPNKQPAFAGGWVYNYAPGKGSALIAAMQRGMGIGADGVVGRQFITSLQQRYGLVADGELWANSPAIKEFQRRLNRGTW